MRGEYTKILSRVVKHIDESSVSDMRILTNEDPEVDFFENVRHIQVKTYFMLSFFIASFGKRFCRFFFI